MQLHRPVKVTSTMMVMWTARIWQYSQQTLGGQIVHDALQIESRPSAMPALPVVGTLIKQQEDLL